MNIVKPGDLFPFLITVGIIILISLNVYTSSTGEPVVYIQADEGEYLFPLDEVMDVEVEGPLGLSHVHIDGGSVRFSDSPCPDKLCVHAAPIDDKGDWNACLPNRIFIKIQGGEEEHSNGEVLDDISY